MTRISNERYFLTSDQRAEIIKEQEKNEPARARRWAEKKKILIAAEKERGRCDHSLFTRILNQKEK